MAKNYTKNRWAHLARYAVERGLRCCGLYRGRAYCHILFVEDKGKKFDVVKKNLLKGVKADLLKNLHTDAHHLNSSQILCYNFFRPLIDKNGNAKQELVDLLAKQHIIIEKGANCTFEYEDDLGDETQFDFHIKSGETEVFFEIKYTENGFASYSKESSARTQYKERYAVQFGKQNCLVEKPQDEDDFIKKAKNDYQLYRNTVRITDKKKYVVLLYPGENKSVEKQAKAFVETKVKPEYQENIKRVYWENIVDKESELYKKYFAE